MSNMKFNVEHIIYNKVYSLDSKQKVFNMLRQRVFNISKQRNL